MQFDLRPDVHLRLMLYKRIASTPSREELDELKVEIIDRFGPIPPFAQSLFRAAYLKLRAASLGIRKIDAGASNGYILFEEQEQDRTETRAQAHSRQAQGIPSRRSAQAALCPHRPYRGGALPPASSSWWIQLA